MVNGAASNPKKHVWQSAGHHFFRKFVFIFSKLMIMMVDGGILVYWDDQIFEISKKPRNLFYFQVWESPAALRYVSSRNCTRFPKKQALESLSQPESPLHVLEQLLNFSWYPEVLQVNQRKSGTVNLCMKNQFEKCMDFVAVYEKQAVSNLPIKKGNYENQGH